MNLPSLPADIRETDLYRQARDLLGKLRGAGHGQLGDAAELDVAADGRNAVFAGTVVEALEGVPPTRLWHVDLDTGALRALTADARTGPEPASGPAAYSDRSPRFSPDGTRLAFLSDRSRAGDFQLYLLDPADAAIRPAPTVAGWVEYFHWSPDGERILLGVAGHGADTAGAQGAVTSRQEAASRPDWLPTVETGDETYLWRTAWICDLRTQQVRQVNRPGTNIWEAVWCGDDALVAVVSPDPDEGAWYGATLARIDVETGAERLLYRPRDQLGCLAGAPSGRHLAVVEAVCSDRGLVAGDALVVATGDGSVRRLDTRGVDVGGAQWRSDDRLLLTGQRAFESVALLYDAGSDALTETWASEEITTGGRNRYFTVAGIGADGDCALVGEGFLRAPEIAVIRNGRYRAVCSLDQGYAEWIARFARVEPVRWQAPDGLEIHGWLMTPQRKGPHALVMEIHGGPVWQWRGRWLGREGLYVLMLIERGYAVFWPNPRGSSGRGQAFARRVQGDMCGADTHDYLSGLDHLVERGIADAGRLGVMGRSYGGCMTSWLVTQDTRFAAAVALAPVTNQTSHHLTSNIGYFDALFLDDEYRNPGGRYFQRSAVMHAHKARTPTLNIAGALDRCTPPGQALEFHTALREHGVPSALIIYPREGHGNKELPAVIDYAARVAGWFGHYMPGQP